MKKLVNFEKVNLFNENGTSFEWEVLKGNKNKIPSPVKNRMETLSKQFDER